MIFGQNIVIFFKKQEIIRKKAKTEALFTKLSCNISDQLLFCIVLALPGSVKVRLVRVAQR